MNAYGFAGGDPVNFSDPFGLCPPEVTNKPCKGPLGEGASYQLADRKGGSRTHGSLFGATRDGGAKDHTGIDLKTLGGETVYAGGDGIVTRAGYRGEGSGNGVQITVQGNGSTGTMEYFHMDYVAVREGDWVAAGGWIGTALGAPGGSSGIPTGTDAHIDFKVTVNGRYIDPVSATPALQGKGLEGISCRTNPKCK